MSLKEIIREKYTLRMIESNDPYISEDRREKISLRKRVATLSSEFPESSSVKTKGGKRGTVLSVGKDYVKVAHGNRQKDYHPSQLTREESEALKGPIEESYKKKYETAPEGVKAVADYMATLKKQPTDTLKRMANQHYKVHSANSKNELVGMLMRAKFGKKKLEAHDSHFQTEQKQGVAEEYTLQERINIADAEMGDVIKDFYKSNAPQFKGKSKEKRREMAIAAKLEADREAGIKESVSIDEASRSSLQEELKGNQHKIDKNKNGEIDSDDFKLLRLNPGDEVHATRWFWHARNCSQNRRR
jgi:hypothetical protein